VLTSFLGLDHFAYKSSLDHEKPTTNQNPRYFLAS